jgi:hypothetical protein
LKAKKPWASEPSGGRGKSYFMANGLSASLPTIGLNPSATGWAMTLAPLRPTLLPILDDINIVDHGIMPHFANNPAHHIVFNLAGINRGRIDVNGGQRTGNRKGYE